MGGAGLRARRRLSDTFSSLGTGPAAQAQIKQKTKLCTLPQNPPASTGAGGLQVEASSCACGGQPRGSPPRVPRDLRLAFLVRPQACPPSALPFSDSLRPRPLVLTPGRVYTGPPALPQQEAPPQASRSGNPTSGLLQSPHLAPLAFHTLLTHLCLPRPDPRPCYQEPCI